MINNQQYPLTYSLFVKWFKSQPHFCEQDESDLQNFLDLEYVENSYLFGSDNFFKNFTYFNRGSLLEFLDEQGLYIEITIDYTMSLTESGKPRWYWKLTDWNRFNEKGDCNLSWCNEPFMYNYTRSESYLCAITKAFELLENKLKNVKQWN